VAPASYMAAMVREAGITTSVPSDAECSSACMLIFAGGAYRYVWRGGHLGVHSVSANGVDDPEFTTVLARRWLLTAPRLSCLANWSAPCRAT
jgi:hypothetical protein